MSFVRDHLKNFQLRVQKLTAKQIKILRRSWSEDQEQALFSSKTEPSGDKSHYESTPLTPKERMKRRKEELASKRRMELKLAAVDNGDQRMVIKERAMKMIYGVCVMLNYSQKKTKIYKQLGQNHEH